MPQLIFTQNIRRHLECPEIRISGKTVHDVLERAFADNPALRDYVLDDQGHLREHINVFVDEQRIDDRENLSDPVAKDSEVFIMQALSGG